MKLFNNKIYKINYCPLCKSSRRKLHGRCNKNLYSEFLSKIIKVDEETLINYIKDYKCSKCNLIYKNYWFKDEVLEELFSKKILLHPKGMDIYKNNFNKKRFLNEIKKFKLSHKKNLTLHNKSKRTIGSIVSAIRKNSLLKKRLIKEINLKKLNFLKITVLSNKLSKFITYPKRFSRFVGYNDLTFWKFIKKNSNKIFSYAEVGCPSWGLLKKAKEDGKDIFFYKRKENNFWKEEKGCLKKARLEKKEIITNIKVLKKISLFGIIEYLDHLNNPYKFLKEINSLSKNFFIILEKDNKGIQHFTSWTKKSLNFLSYKLKRNVKIFNNYTKEKNIIIAIFN